MMIERNTPIKMYGTTWCYDTKVAQKVFSEEKIEYEFIDIDRNIEGSRLVVEINKGYRSVPTILFPDGSKMVEPSEAELRQKLQKIKS
jgi:mycoredoxin